MNLLITILAYILALAVSAVANIIGLWLFLPLTHVAANTEERATELRLSSLRERSGGARCWSGQ